MPSDTPLLSDVICPEYESVKDQQPPEEISERRESSKFTIELRYSLQPQLAQDFEFETLSEDIYPDLNKKIINELLPPLLTNDVYNYEVRVVHAKRNDEWDPVKDWLVQYLICRVDEELAVETKYHLAYFNVYWEQPKQLKKRECSCIIL